MSEREQGSELSAEDAVYHYAVMCLAGLALVLAVLLYRGLGSWSFLPVLVGLTGVLLRWRWTPAATLLLLTGSLFVHETLQQEGAYRMAQLPSSRFSLSDWLLSGAVLAYRAGHYRLLGLTRSLFPRDRRQQSAETPGAGIPQLVSRTVPAWEVGGLVLSLPVCAFLSQLAWIAVPPALEDEGLSSLASKAVLLVWIVIIGLLAASGFLGYLGQCRLMPTEARLFLQDVYWRETRTEQRRLGHWLAWAQRQQRMENRS